MQQDIPFLNIVYQEQQKQNLQVVQNKISKKKAKKQQKKLVYLQKKAFKKQIQKNKKKQAQELKKANSLQKQFIQKPKSFIEMPKKKKILKQKVETGLKIIIDLGFWKLMTQKQQKSLIRQLSYCQNCLKNSKNPLNITLAGCTPSINQILQHQFNAQNWVIFSTQKSIKEIKAPLIYLTGDSQNQIQKFDFQFAYVIGGIVDHNRYKKLTYNYAVENDISTARLPLKDAKLKSSCHLAVNHVVQMISKRMDDQSWQQAVKVIPKRKRE